MEYIEKTSNYLIKLYKSINKSRNEALEMVVWYARTDEEQAQIEHLINDNWNKIEI